MDLNFYVNNKVDELFQNIEFLKREFNFSTLNRKPTILIVDDNSVYLKIITKTLKQHSIFDGANIISVNTSNQAFNLCKEYKPDLMLLDVEMPNKNGFQVLEELKKDHETKDISVIFITTHETTEIESFSLISGGLDFIPKPINPKVLIARVLTQLKLKFQADLLKELAFLDKLTGIYNRRYFENQLDIEWSRAIRNKESLSLLMIDVDSFKSYNDHYGHLKGDMVLKEIATAMNKIVKRPGDIVARYGGEEFMCILPNTNLSGAIKVAEDFKKAILELNIEHIKSNLGIVSISIGLVEKNDNDLLEEFINNTDKKLYEAKNSGRNCIKY